VDRLSSPVRRLACAALFTAAALTHGAPAWASAGGGVSRAPPASGSQKASSEAAAYTFLDEMMDKYATGTTPRLVRSFEGGHLAHFTDSETYDDALTIDAYLNEGTADGVARAETVGQGLLYVQAHDPAGDGRIREAYAPTPLTGPSAVTITDSTSDVGNMAWVGMALAQLYRVTGDSAFLSGAAALARWVVTNCTDSRGAGGYTGGETGTGAKIEWKSTEHNIDLVGLFSMLAQLTGDTTWTADAGRARSLVEAMWDATAGDFFVGTTDDGVTRNVDEQPEDVNSWSYLALGDSAYASSVGWDVTNLSVTNRSSSGVEFCLGDKDRGVWFEGTAHLVDALEFRQQPGDAARAAQYLADIGVAQLHGRNGDGLGIIAASVNRLSDCDGDYYYASLHTGATSWYLMALEAVNPFVLLSPGTAGGDRRGPDIRPSPW
jgi:hypothetical protein